MKLSRTLLALFALSILALAGCTETLTSPGASKTTLLTQYTWKTVSFKVDGSDQTAASLKLQTFKTDGTYSADNGAKTGSWEFNVDTTNLVVDKGQLNEVNWNILILSSTELKLKANGANVLEYDGVPQ